MQSKWTCTSSRRHAQRKADHARNHLSQAVNEASPKKCAATNGLLIGEDVAEAGTPFKILSGLVEEFGTDRVIDTPIAEPGSWASRWGRDDGHRARSSI